MHRKWKSCECADWNDAHCQMTFLCISWEFLELTCSRCDDNDVCDDQWLMFQTAQLTAVGAVNKLNFPLWRVALLFLSCSSSTDFEGAGTWGRHFCETFDIPGHSLTPVDSHSWTRGSLINCLTLIVAVFWSGETSKTTDSWNNVTCLDSSYWDPP